MGSQREFLNAALCFNSLVECEMKCGTVLIYLIFFQCRLKVGDCLLAVSKSFD